MICKKCGTEFDGAFCPRCGERAEEKLTVCPVCGKERAEGETFCSKCGYSYENARASKEKVTRKKVDFSKVKKAFEDKYWIIPSAGRLLLGVLVLLSLIAPVMTHAGVNTAGNGYVNAFGVNVTTTYTVCCAALLIAGVYTLVYGAYTLIRAFMRRYFDVGKKLYYILDGVLCVIVAVIGCIGCAGAGDWYADAGAGLSLCVFVGIAGVALLCLRILYENKWFDKKLASEDPLNSERDRTREKKLNKPYGITVSVISAALVIAIAITSVVSILYKSPFNFTASGFAETRADVIKQFGVPEGAGENDSSFTYYSSEYTNIDKMIEALQTAQEEASEDIDEDIGEDFEEGNLEDAFGEDEKYEIAIDSLKEKKEKLVYKKTTVTFDNLRGTDRKEDIVKSYVCEVVVPADGEQQEERKLKKINVKDSLYFDENHSANFSYVARYDDGSFSRGVLELNENSFDEEKNAYIFSDILGEYTVSVDKLDRVSLSYYGMGVIDNVLYVSSDVFTPNAVIVADTKNTNCINTTDLSKVTTIHILDGVEEILSPELFKNLTNVTEIITPSSLKYLTVSSIYNTAYYKDPSNWEDGYALYMDNFLAETKKDVKEEYVVRDGTTAINQRAFYNKTSLKSITIPASVTSIGADAFFGCELTTANIPASAIRSITGDKLKTVIINSGTRIGNYAFENCKSLESITIPDSITSIDNSAFVDCRNIIIFCKATSKPDGWDSNWNSGNPVIWGCDNNNVASDGYIYYTDENIRYALKDGNAVVSRYTDTVSDNIEIPSSVSYKGRDYIVIMIDEYAFAGCSFLTSVTIPDSVERISPQAFSGCSSLTSAIFENSMDWKVSGLRPSGGTSVPSTDLADPATAAKYLTDTYCDYYWNRG